MVQECFWPSGRTIRRMNWDQTANFLATMGVEGPYDGYQLSDLRRLVAKLKRDSHERGDCECPAAAYIRAGGGQPRRVHVTSEPGPGGSHTRAKETQ